jgi:hypothetical protein
VFVPVLDDRDLASHLVWSSSSRLVTDVWVAGVAWCATGVRLGRRQAREVQARAERLAVS